MTKKFEKYYQIHELFSKNDKILVTVSGGRDSVAMVYLFKAAKLNFGIAHCNFKLRGIESDKDEKFVQNLAKELDVHFHTISFNTMDYSVENGISTQMAARELRYNWFEEIRLKNGYHFIATAHHKNDVAETVLINITKGTGLSGLHGIKNKTGKIIRPLLGLNRAEIDSFIKENNIEFREDKSNEETKYVRNKIRHNVIPELEKINPSFIETVINETQQFSELEELVELKIEEDRKSCFFNKNGVIEIDINKLLMLKPLRTYVYYFLKPFGFNFSDVVDVMNALDKQSGKTFFSKSHQITKDRDRLIINEINKKVNEEFIINELTDFSKLPIKIVANLFNVAKQPSIKKNKQFAYLDIEKISFPLTFRKWKSGDKFKPFGMKNNKKLSDFFIDEKLSLLEKENTWLLCTKNKIVWVVGHRIDEDFKITAQSKNILILELK